MKLLNWIFTTVLVLSTLAGVYAVLTTNEVLHHTYDTANITGTSVANGADATKNSTESGSVGTATLQINQAASITGGLITTQISLQKATSFTICTGVNVTATADGTTAARGITGVSGWMLFATNYTGWGCGLNKFCLITWGLAGGTEQDNVTSNTNVVIGVPHYVCVVHDEAGLKNKMYVDGVNEKNGTAATWSGFTPTASCLGTYDCIAADGQNMVLDETAFWTRALSDAEITNAYGNYTAKCTYPYNCGGVASTLFDACFFGMGP